MCLIETTRENNYKIKQDQSPKKIKYFLWNKVYMLP